MTTTYATPSRTLVRTSHAEDGTWRAVFPMIGLALFVTLGESLDAPEIMPAGSMRADPYGPTLRTAFRE